MIVLKSNLNLKHIPIKKPLDIYLEQIVLIVNLPIAPYILSSNRASRALYRDNLKTYLQPLLIVIE